MKNDETETPSITKHLDLDNLLDTIRTNLKSKLQLSPVDLERLDKIQKSSHILDDNVSQLENTIKAILDKQYDEYVKTFEQFMDSVRKELREKIEAMELEEKKRQKMNDIRIIKCERDFFRLEAIRLNGLCKDMSTKIEEMAFRMKLLTNELNTMTTKWKESENVNKQLLVELESNIQSMKDIEKENNELKEKIIQKEIESSEHQQSTEAKIKEQKETMDQYTQIINKLTSDNFELNNKIKHYMTHSKNKSESEDFSKEHNTTEEAKENELFELRIKNESLQETIKDKDTKIENLQTELKQKENDLCELYQQNKKKDDLINKSKNASSISQGLSLDDKELLDRYKAKHHEDKTEIKMLREQIQVLKSEMRKQSKEIPNEILRQKVMKLLEGYKAKNHLQEELISEIKNDLNNSCYSEGGLEQNGSNSDRQEGTNRSSNTERKKGLFSLFKKNNEK